MLKKKPRLPLILSVKARNWRQNDEHAAAADAEFQHVRRRILDEDDQTCRFCGFKAQSWQEVHHTNDDHADNRPENLATTCMFCHLCQHVGRAGAVGEAVLIWCPEIPQDRLHHIVRTYLVAQRWAEGYLNGAKHAAPRMQNIAMDVSNGAKAIASKLRSREEDAKRYLGTSSAAILGEVLQSISPSSEAYGKREKHLTGIRLLPTGNRFQGGGDIMPKIIDSWLSTGGPYASLTPPTWSTLIVQHTERAVD